MELRETAIEPAVLVAPDKFRGTVTAAEAAEAMARGAGSLGWSVRQMPLADGGEGLLEALGPRAGARRTVEVEGPLGRPVVAGWVQSGRVAVVEMAQASGLLLAGGAAGNDPLRASTRGTGQLIVAAARSVAAEPSAGGEPATVVVGLGGSATTDGGWGALSAVEEAGGLGDVALVGACDVDVGFVDAAPRFGPQKGADPDQVDELATRLERLAGQYLDRYGVDVRAVPGAGAAGGLGGAIVVLGGRLRSGYEVVTDLLGFREALAASRVVLTGEGAFDATSLLGKVVGSVLDDAATAGVPVLVVAGTVTAEAAEAAAAAGATVISLVERYGRERALGDTARCIEEAAAEGLATLGAP
jgi:glycerate kinase